jgi:hypothetical protein
VQGAELFRRIASEKEEVGLIPKKVRMVEIISKTFLDTLGNLFFDVSYRTEEGTLIEKRLAAEDYLDLFKSSVSRTETFISIPRLPENVLSAKISDLDRDSFEAVVFLPAKKMQFLYMNQHFLLPYPALVAKIKVVKGERAGMWLFALDTNKPSETSVLYHYPYGNVWESGYCCFGNIRSSYTISLSNVFDVLDDFLMGETNGHLWDSSRVKNKYESQGALVEAVSKMEKFPKRLMVKMQDSNMSTLADLMK